jgi:glycine cleavage system P protein (glycine dehydrogenase) subunit 1
MPFLLNTPEDQQAMLEAIGVASLDALFDMVPADLRLRRDLNLPPAMTELELTAHIESLAKKNTPCGQRVCFLGGGCYDHFIPAAVDAIAGRGEFYTSYTPYQAEASQGNLQAFFEYQTLITRLVGMDVSNASLYDGATAAAEAVLMSCSATGRHGRVIVAESVHPEYRQTLTSYLTHLDMELVTLPTSDGAIPPAELAAAIDDRTACVLVQHPNFFGCLEDVEALVEIAHERGAMFVVAVDPISLGLLKRPGEYHADIVVAEGQSLGTPMQYGGPYLGIMACREGLVRRMPGRIAGETVDRRGKRCWVLTLQTREQHIRREKATSNICTNQGLLALRATVYLSLLGPQGLRELSELCLQKTRYAAETLTRSDRFSLAFSRPVFKEFVVRDRAGAVEPLLAQASAAGFFAGVPLGQWYPELADCFLVAVTEKRTKQEIDALAACLAGTESSACNENAPVKKAASPEPARRKTAANP